MKKSEIRAMQRDKEEVEKLARMTDDERTQYVLNQLRRSINSIGMTLCLTCAAVIWCLFILCMR